jgi:hypothetical protein
MRAAARTQRALPIDDVPARPAVSPVPSSRGTIVLKALGVILLFWGLTFVMTYPQVKGLGGFVSVDTEEGTPFESLQFASTARQIRRHAAADANIFYPERTRSLSRMR